MKLIKPYVTELKGKDIIDAYNGDYLSTSFGYSCANFNVDYDNHIDMSWFDIYTDNINNISCFVYVNEYDKIEGRRMFFKGKQLLDHKVFPIDTKLGETVYYLYGFYGNDISTIVDRAIIRNVIKKYGKNIIHMDNGSIVDGSYIRKKHYFIMQIDNMDYDEFPAIDFLYASYKLRSFANFNPSEEIIKWLENKYKIDDITFGSAYHYKKLQGVDKFQHWNQKAYDDDDEEWDEIEDDDI